MNSPRALRTCLVAITLVLSLTTSLLADVVHLKGGRKLEGKIVGETASSIKIQTRFGTTDVKRVDIVSIVRGRTPREEYDARRAKLEAGDLSGRFELAVYCKENKLRSQYKALLTEILKADPQHEGANEELGRLKYQGKWYTKAGLEKFKIEEKSKMEALGLVVHEGKWMSPEEAMEAKGYVNVNGNWITRAEADRLSAAAEFEKFFEMPLTISDSAHFSVRNTRTAEENQYLLDVCEDAYDFFVEISEPDETEMKFFEHYKFHIYILDHPTDVRKFIESGYIDRYTPPKDTRERYLDCTNFSYFFPMPLIVLSEGRHLIGGGNREVALTGMAMIHLGQILIRRLKRGGGLPGWAEGGVAHYFEGDFNGYSTVSVIEYPHYEPFVDKWIDGWETFPKWQEKLAEPGTLNRLPSLRKIMEVPIEELKVDVLAKSWSLVSFLFETRRKQFFAFCRDAKIKFRGERISCTEAFDKAFAPESAEDVEKAWQAWLKDPNRARREAAKKTGILK